MGQEDLRLKITSDTKQGEDGVKRTKRLIRSLDKVVKESNNRRKKSVENRVKRVKKAESELKAVQLANIQRLMALDAKQTKAKKQEAEKRRKEKIRQETAAAKHSLAIVKRSRAKQVQLAKQKARDEVRIEKLAARKKEQVLKAHQRRRRAINQRQKRVGRYALGAAGIGGIGVLFKARDVLDYQVALARVAIQAGISQKAQMELGETINRTSIAFGVSRKVLVEGIETVVDKSGDLSLAVDNLDGMAKLLRGTKSEAADVGALFASVKNAFKGTGLDLKNSEILDFVEVLVAQGDKGQITIAELASEGEKLFGAFKGAGFRTKKDFINFGAIIQSAGESGKAAEAATSSVRFLSALTKRQGEIKKFGFDVFKPGSNKELKELDVIIKGLMKISGGDVTKLQKLFPNEKAIALLKILGAEYKNTNGEIKSLTNSIKIGETAANNIQKKYDRVAKTGAQGFARMGAAFEVLIDKTLTDSLNQISGDIVSMLDNEDAMNTLRLTFEAIGKTLSIAAKIPGFFVGLGKLAARDTVRKEEGRQGNIKRVMDAQVERLELKFNKSRTDAQEKRLQDLNVFITNNIDSEGNYIVDVRAKATEETEEKIKTIYAGKFR